MGCALLGDGRFFHPLDELTGRLGEPFGDSEELPLEEETMTSRPRWRSRPSTLTPAELLRGEAGLGRWRTLARLRGAWKVLDLEVRPCPTLIALTS